MHQAREMLAKTGQFPDLMGYDPHQLWQLIRRGRPYMMNVVSEPVTESEGAPELKIFDFGTYDTRTLLGQVLQPFHRYNTKAWGYEFDPPRVAHVSASQADTRYPMYPVPGFHKRAKG